MKKKKDFQTDVELKQVRENLQVIHFSHINQQLSLKKTKLLRML